jgi:4-diphosphocytidyl-2-C-methyl-D-erythritol kinase
MIRFPNCKINLGLNVVSKLPDGYHEIETVFCPVNLTDALEIMPAADGIFRFESTGLEIPGVPEDNLCVKAFRLLQSDFDLPAVKIHLHKAIPMGSGLGGGSSDGAFTLQMINDIFGLGMELNKLKEYARKLGSDCAFFLENEPRIASGRGDVLEPLSLPVSGLFLVIVVPDVHVDTSWAYRKVSPYRATPTIRDLTGLPPEAWKDHLINDFEKPVTGEFPVIAEIKQHLYDSGAVYASMSGSGSAVYGLFREKPLTPHYSLLTTHSFHFGAIL